MLELNKGIFAKRDTCAKVGLKLPTFNYEKMLKVTRNNPVWVHFGAGNIFRGYPARLQNILLDKGEVESGIVACEAFDYSIIDQIYRPFDNLTLSLGIRLDGSLKKDLVASIADSIAVKPDNTVDMARLKAYFRNSSLQMVSFTITETGYRLGKSTDDLFPLIQHDMEHKPCEAVHTMGITAELLYERYQGGGAPLALVSLDNCTKNGAKLQQAILAIASAWKQKGFVEDGFLKYLTDSRRIAFPWSMIDKITPMPASWVQKLLSVDGFSHLDIVRTEKGTVIAPFVNAEIPEYLVIEDTFPNGRPPLEKVGVLFTNRETVNKTERMKVTGCLNPLMSALGIFGCLLNFHTLADEMEDQDLSVLVRRLGEQEGLPIVEDAGLINPQEFLNEVLTKRLPNKYIPDTPERTAMDLSQKMPNRFGQIIKTYSQSQKLKLENLVCVPLIIAGWFRYLMAVDDQGKKFNLSRDPLLSEFTGHLKNLQFGLPDSYHGQLLPILADENIFLLNLNTTVLAEKIIEMFRSMLQGPGAVRQTLHKYLSE